MAIGEKGTYVLILHLTTQTRLTIGKRGDYDFAVGWYAYVGSAFGPGGLRGRLSHHLAPVKKPHWHIDYLRQKAPVQAVWYLASETVYEHLWADTLRAFPGATTPVHRFGASDCKCESHLVYFPARPDYTAFCEQTGLAIQWRDVDRK